MLGICLGHQLLALATGHETFKLPFGHRGANHPVVERATGRVLVTSQNHGFAVAPSEAREATHVSLYDGTVEGLDYPELRARSVQFHPEAGPGPHDAWRLIDRWLEEVGGLPRRPDIESICLIGSGPIVIGQACEFDYAGCQALKVLREDGFRTIVVNSNPATIMTDPGFADRTYLEPLDLEGVADVLERERPDALLPTMGGQTALNLAVELGDAGVLDDLGVELIGAPIDVIRRAEDRERFRETVRETGPAGARVDHRHLARRRFRPISRCPVILRPAFTLGGHGGGTARTPEELDAAARARSRREPGRPGARRGVAPRLGRVRARADARPRGQRRRRLLDREPRPDGRPHGRLGDRRAADDALRRGLPGAARRGDRRHPRGRRRLRRLEHPVRPRTARRGELRVIEMNPRVSRSSALASKATGYPIAKVAAKLAVGYTLDEIPNDLTGTTPASFEPTLDYVVVKFPRFAFEKFPGADTTLGTQMKSVGEAMGIGRTFGEAFLKARRSRELDGADAWELPEGVHPWFRAELERLEALASSIVDDLVADDWLRLKRLGHLGRGDRGALRDDRGDRAGEAAGVGGPAGLPAGRLVRGRGRGRRRTTSTRPGARPTRHGPNGDKPRVVILGSGPNRIGQGIEFDYCCVHAAQAFRALGYEAVMVNCNPETVSTDYDTSDRLYFEPLGAEEVLEICARELPDGVVIQFGGQTPLKLAREIESEGWRILGTPFDAVDLAEDRERFAALCDELDVAVPSWAMADGPEEAVYVAEAIGYPVLVRPSYVLGGRNMQVCYDERRGRRGGRTGRADPGRPLPRGRDRDRRRRALRRAGHLRRGRHGARRGGRRALRRLVVRPAGAVARRGDAAERSKRPFAG